MKIYNSISEMVGHTPLLKLTNYNRNNNLYGNVIAKVESLNPGGSIKDRVAKNMIEKAETDGTLKKSTVIIEPTSGNTGIGLAAIGASKGYKVIITMPDTMSVERINLMKAFGAEVILTDGKLGMAGSIKKAEELHKEYPDSIIAGQFVNPANPEAHIKSTGPEIYEDTDGKVDILVAGVGTGGTVTGIGGYLKSKIKDLKVVAVEPASSALLSGNPAGPHKIQGIGANFIPDILNREIIDEIIQVTNDDAYTVARDLAKSDGLLVGISSGAAVWAAKEVAKRPENQGKNIVVILPDTGDRYLSTDLFNY